ncbi:MAG: PD-(D/E)XK nuclease family protein [Cyanobacteria bacterium P01_G01_bin.4]
MTTYPISASRLQSYHRCPQEYYFRYERRVPAQAFFGSQSLGHALHAALATIHRDWHYTRPRPEWQWLVECWQQASQRLPENLVVEGQRILRRYFDTFIATRSTLHRPVGVESRIQGRLQVENIEFSLTGRYDRLDWLDDGLELIDYKSNREIVQREPAETDLQLGLYYLALEQHYGASLKRLSFIYLRQAKVVSFDVTPEHRDRVEATIADLALRLRQDREWPAQTGQQCDRCSYARYCDRICDSPEPLPEMPQRKSQLQLVLGL